LKVSFAKIFFLDYPFEKPFDILKLLAELGVCANQQSTV
jgi:hypothetical protein